MAAEALRAYPVTHRYSPLGDLRALDFRRDHPTFDGRGVTMGLIDLSPDPLEPELQVATSIDGKPIQKIIVYENSLDPDEEDDGRWLRMKDGVTATGGQFSYEGQTYTAPHDGAFRIELLDEVKFDSLSRAGVDKDLNRDGNPKDASHLFAVIWDEQSDNVWVDTNQNHSFTDEKAFTDFSVRPEFGVLGHDDPATPVRESVGFGVQIDHAKKRVALNLGVAQHASLITGSALGSRGTNGRFDGVAPGAQLGSFPEGGAAYGQTEAVIRAVKNPRVDVVWMEQSSGITRPYTLRDGRLVPTVIYGRLIAKYHKPLIIPTHNYPVLGGTDDIVMADGAIGIGGQEGKENFLVNHGVRVEHDDNLLITGGYGPMGNGAFGADIISPSNYISGNRGFEEAGGLFAGLYKLPPGYRISGGTSTATPTAAGAVALLISAAKQTGVHYDAFRIKQAVVSTARYVPHLPAYKQGSGVFNVGAAWDMLQQLDKAPPMVAITSHAPVRHVLSGLLPTPNAGVGLYEREGWAAGDHGERTVTFTRTTGPKQDMAFNLNWIGNDSATFSAPASVTLPLNKPVPVSIAIAPRSAGAHTAILTLDNATLPGHAYRMLTAIVAAEQLTSANNFSVQQKVEVPRPEMRSWFYNVPAGATALRIDIAGATRELAVAAVEPDTRTAQAVRATPENTGRGRGGGGGGRGGGAGMRATYIVNDPMPGVWEVRLSDLADMNTFDYAASEKGGPVPPTPATLTVSALASDVAVQPEAAALNRAGGTATYELAITNRMAAFNGAAAGVPLGSARREHPTIHEKEQNSFDIDVPPGSTNLLVRVSRPADAGADLDVYVFDCTGKNGCSRSPRTDSDPLGDEVVTVNNPAAGKWRVVVDAPTVPSQTTTYDYLDVVLNPSFGGVSTADVAHEHKVGEHWTVQAHAWLAATLPAGRVPFAAVLLQGQLQGAVPFNLNLEEITSTAGAGGSGGRH